MYLLIEGGCAQTVQYVLDAVAEPITRTLPRKEVVQKKVAKLVRQCKPLIRGTILGVDEDVPVVTIDKQATVQGAAGTGKPVRATMLLQPNFNSAEAQTGKPDNVK